MWRKLSKEALDRAYNNSLAVTGSASIVEHWTAWSELARHQLQGECNVSYGASPFQSFDFFPAQGDAPLVVFVHGGFWQMRSKDDFTFIVPALVNAGIGVAMLGYTLAPFAKMDQIVLDVRNGLQAIHDHTMLKNTRPKKMWLLGWSAGAHLVSMVQDDEKVLGGTAISGIYDLEPMRHCYINEKLCLDEPSSLRNSPIRLPQTVDKPLDIFVGSGELPEMQRQSIDFAAYRKSLGCVGNVENLPGKNHYTVLEALTNTDGAILQSIQRRLALA